MYKIMTPGPTNVPQAVMDARSRWFPNPDVDISFCEEYRQVCLKLAGLMHTENEVFIMDGEGILGLEAACASLTEPGDRVLVIDNGIYGKGFADFVSMYGGNPVLYTTDYRRPVATYELARFLEKDHDFKYATVVHCDTPSGVLNIISEICPLLKSHGILTVVDSVSAMFGAEFRMDDWQIDLACGGSQKALSAPPGLTFVAVSRDALSAMENRHIPIASFYCNILAFRNYYRDKWFPYTMPASDIYGLGEAVDIVMADKDRTKRHAHIAGALRNTVTSAGLSLYLEDGFSPTVTVINVPDGLKADDIIENMKENYGILISGSFDYLSGKVVRIGHMGSCANPKDVAETLYALDKTLCSLGFRCKCDMQKAFENGLIYS